MSVVELKVRLRASPQRVYQALTREAEHWWVQQGAPVSERVGQSLQLAFCSATPASMQLQVLDLAPGQRVAWRISASSEPSWTGSVIAFMAAHRHDVMGSTTGPPTPSVVPIQMQARKLKGG